MKSSFVLVASLLLVLVGVQAHAGDLQLYHGPRVRQGPERKFKSSGNAVIQAFPIYIDELDSHNTGVTVNGGPSYVGFVVMTSRQIERFDGSGINFTWTQQNMGLQQVQICRWHSTQDNWQAFNSMGVWDFFGELDAVGADPGKYRFMVWRDFGPDKIYYQYEVDYLPTEGLGGIKVRFTNDSGHVISGTVSIASDGSAASYLYNGAPIWSAPPGTDGFMSIGDLRSGKRYIAVCRVTATGQVTNIAFSVPKPDQSDDGQTPPHPWLKYEVRVVAGDSAPQVNYLGLEGANASSGGSSYDGPKSSSPFFTPGWWVDLFKSLFIPDNQSVEEWRQVQGQIASWGPVGLINTIRDSWGHAENQAAPNVQGYSVRVGGQAVPYSMDWRTTQEGGTWVGDARTGLRRILGWSVWGLFFFVGYLRWVRPTPTL